jgi:hypothetical protein
MTGKRASRVTRGRRKVASQGIKVTAVSLKSGHPATAVDVELDPVKLKEAIGEYGQVRAVVADIAGERDRDGALARSTQEPLHAVGHPPEAPPPPGTAEHYSSTHLGPSDPRRGVEISVETDAGVVEAQGADESYSVCEEGQPVESTRRRTPKP